MKSVGRLILWTMTLSTVAPSQSVRIQSAKTVSLPAPEIDGNSPAFWSEGILRAYTSTGLPMAMSGSDLLNLRVDVPPLIVPFEHYPLWIESVWQDDDGTVYAWYHHEPDRGCGYKGLRTPDIGALVSTDVGRTFYDLGIVLASGDAPNCDARNGFFAGGHGDFSVILDRNREYFYFLFTNYGGPAQSQGVALARMAFQNRANPVGTVYKYHFGGRRRPGFGNPTPPSLSDASNWSEPGIGGRVTPVLPAAVSWDQSDTDSHWGPAVHWNTHLGRYVILLNRACCEPFWPQEGVYLAFSADLGDPGSWTAPVKILDSRNIGFAPGYYPQVFGADPGETDTLLGQVGRLFIKGVSKWELVFSTTEEAEALAAAGTEEPPGASPPPPEVMNW